MDASRQLTTSSLWNDVNYCTRNNNDLIKVWKNISKRVTVNPTVTEECMRRKEELRAISKALSKKTDETSSYSWAKDTKKKLETYMTQIFSGMKEAQEAIHRSGFSDNFTPLPSDVSISSRRNSIGGHRNAVAVGTTFSTDSLNNAGRLSIHDHSILNKTGESRRSSIVADEIYPHGVPAIPKEEDKPKLAVHGTGDVDFPDDDEIGLDAVPIPIGLAVSQQALLVEENRLQRLQKLEDSEWAALPDGRRMIRTVAEVVWKLCQEDRKRYEELDPDVLLTTVPTMFTAEERQEAYAQTWIGAFIGVLSVFDDVTNNPAFKLNDLTAKRLAFIAISESRLYHTPMPFRLTVLSRDEISEDDRARAMATHLVNSDNYDQSSATFSIPSPSR